MEQILLQDVSFSYDGTPENRVLSHMNLSVKRGDFVALTGHSGIGKSTVFRLLLGVYDTLQGHIQLCTDCGSYEVGTGTRGLFAYVAAGKFFVFRYHFRKCDIALPSCDNGASVAGIKNCLHGYVCAVPGRRA